MRVTRAGRRGMAELERAEGVLHRGLCRARGHILGRVPESCPAFRTRISDTLCLGAVKLAPVKGLGTPIYK